MPNLKLFSWGANTYGQLGHAHNTDLLEPMEIKSVKVDLSTITRITGGGGHTVILTSKGDIYSCGWNNKGQLGIGISCPSIGTFRALENSLNNNYIKISCGWDFTLAITDSNKLYAWGSNEFKQLGIVSSTMSLLSVAVEELKTKKIIDIAAGLRHSLALTGDDEVWSWGTGKHGELGLQGADGNIIKQSEVPQKVSSIENKKIRSVICGAYHSAALSWDGVLYMWGRNNNAQLGKDPVALPVSVFPQQTAFDNLKIMELKSGWTHVICTLDSKEVFSWGRCDFGQLGQESLGNSRYQFQKIKISDHADNIAIGAEHNLMLKDQQVWSWGWNEHGICGTGNEENVPTPQIIKSLTIYRPVIVGVGYGSSYVLVSEDEK